MASADEVHRVVHHVFLPPQLPQSADEESEIPLVNTTLDALIELRRTVGQGPSLQAIDNAISLVVNIKAINCSAGGKVDEMGLLGTLRSLPVGRTLAAKISSQNAAVLITRQPDDWTFEVFELSPRPESVLAAKGRLIRTFPGLAIAVPAAIVDDFDFLETIASTLSTMCHQPAPDMQ